MTPKHWLLVLGVTAFVVFARLAFDDLRFLATCVARFARKVVAK